MQLTRRALVFGASAIGLLPQNVSAQQLTSTPPLPNPTNFQSGDFLWPKKPGAFVPYKYNTSNPVSADESEWHAERKQFLEKIERAPSYFTANDTHDFRQLTFREFYSRYAGDQKPGVPGTYSSGGGLYVGHVGIVEIDSSDTSWVVEALWGKGVVRTLYREWVAGRPGEIVWHGRIRDTSAQIRENVVIEAKKYIGRPYDFWNFDLSSDVGFYCSKLVWLSVWRSMSFAIDGDEGTKRTFWLSPKQLLYSRAVARLHDPAAYANG